MSSASARALEQLRAQEAVLHAQQAEAAAEVARLQAMVASAKADLQETELASVSAKQAVTSACRSFEGCSPETDPLLAHAAASQQPAHVDPVGSRLDAAAAAAAAAADADSSDGSSVEEDEAPPDAAVRPVHIARPSGRGEKLGLFFSNRTTEITRVHPGFAAARAGLAPGWFVRRVCGAETRTLAELDAALQAAAADFTVDVSRAPPPPEDEEEEEEVEVVVEVKEEAAGAGRAVKEATGAGAGCVDGEAAAAACVERAGSGSGGSSSGGDASEDEFVLVGGAETLETPPAVLLETPGSPVERACEDYFGVQGREQPANVAPVAAVPSTVAAAAVAGEKTQEPQPAAAAAAETETPSSGTLPGLDIESFRQFCDKYAREHPEMMEEAAAHAPKEDAGEELMRLQEERRMRELYEDPTAVRELLMRTIDSMKGSSDAASRGTTPVVPAAAAAAAAAPVPPVPTPAAVRPAPLSCADGWRADYSARVQAREAQKEAWAARLSETDDAAAASEREQWRKRTPVNCEVTATTPTPVPEEAPRDATAQEAVAAAAAAPAGPASPLGGDLRNMRPSDLIKLAQQGLAPEAQPSAEEEAARRDAAARAAAKAEEESMRRHMATPDIIPQEDLLAFFDSERWP